MSRQNSETRPEEPQLSHDILGMAPALVVAYDVRTGEYLYVNDASQRLLGYSKDHILKEGFKFVASLIHPDDMQRIDKENSEALKTANSNGADEVVAFEYRMRHRDGSWRWVHSDARVFRRDSKGKVTHVMNVTLDITDRKQQQEEMRSNLLQEAQRRQSDQEKLNLTIQAAQIGTWDWDLATGRLQWSEQMKRLCGLSPDADIDYTSTLKFHHPDDRPRTKAILDEAMKSGKKYEVEYRVIWPDGTHHWLLAQGKPVKKGRKTVGMLGAAINIDESKQHEAEITKTKQQLEESEQRYRAFVSNSSEGIWRFELEKPMSVKLAPGAQIKHMYRYAYLAEANDAMARMYGFDSTKPLLGARLKDLLVESDPENHAYLKAFIASGYKLSGIESHEHDRFGNDKFFRNSLVGFIENGMVMRAWGTQSDVTEAHTASRRLQQSEERLALALEASDTGMWEWDIRTDTLVWSDELKRIYGLRPHDVVDYTRYMRLLHPDDRDRMKETITRARRDGKPYALEHRVIWPDSTTHWVLGKGRAFIEKGKAVRMLGTSMNIDERKDAELRVQQSEAKFRELFTAAPLAIFIATGTGRLIDANKNAARILGYTYKTLLTRDITHLLQKHDVALLWKLRKNKPDGDTYEGRLNMRRKDGQMILTDISARRLPDGKWMAFVRDVTEAVKHQQTAEAANIQQQVLEERGKLLDEQQEQITLLNKTKDEFLSVASHHLRTPASAVKMYLGLLREGYAGELENDQKSYIEQAYQSNEQQLQVIDDILNVAEMDADRVSLQLKREDIVKLTKEVIENLADKFNQRRHDLSFKTSSPHIKVPVDAIKMRIVIENIIGNASKYSPQGKRIWITIMTDKHDVIIRVRDEGVGIRKVDMGKIFDKFARIRNEAYISESGTGLGLYWAKRIVEMHGGDIMVESKFGKGSSFMIRLPLK